MAKKKSSKKRIRFKPVPVNCIFCKENRLPDYKEYLELGKYMTDRAKIMPKTRTGLCAKHQRRVAKQIKRARHLGLLPFTTSL